MKNALLAALLLITGMIAHQVQAQTFKVGVLDAQVMGFRDEENSLKGFEVELAQEICKQISISCEIRLQSFSENLRDIKEGNLNFILSSVLVTEERQKQFLFSQHYMRSASVYIGLPSQPEYRKLKIAVVRHSMQEAYLRQKKADTVDTVIFDDITDTSVALKKGEVDQILGPAVIQLAFISEHQGYEFELLGEPLREHNLGGKVAVVLPKGSEKLQEDVNHALTQILTNGSYNLLNNKYFPFSVY